MYKNIVKTALKGSQEKAMNNYRFQTVWCTPADIDRIWEILANYADWPIWWRGIQSVKVVRNGDESGVGTVLRQRWRSWVPYTLVFDLEMLRIESNRVLDGRASGDLEGACRWTFTPVSGGTEIRFDVNIRTGRWWMNLPLPFAPRIVRANFESIMSWGREGLARKLGAPVELLLQ
ncbi:MAG: SRPBCC family protein [Chloroflexota bacterium]